MWLILIFCSGKKSSWIREKSSPMFGYANSMSGLADGMSFTWAISILCQCHATLYYSKQPHCYIPFVHANIEVGMNLNKVYVALGIEVRNEDLEVFVVDAQVFNNPITNPCRMFCSTP